MKPRLIGLTGAAGAGKDTVAQFIAAYGYHVTAFAEPIKRKLADRFGFPYEDWDDREAKEVCLAWFGRSALHADGQWFSRRSWAQWLGTDFAREVFGHDCWLHAMERRLPELYAKAPGRVVITDVRFDNEAAFIRNRGGEVWHIIRPAAQPIPEAAHISERGVDSEYYSLSLSNNGSLAQLCGAVASLMRRGDM